MYVMLLLTLCILYMDLYIPTSLKHFPPYYIGCDISSTNSVALLLEYLLWDWEFDPWPSHTKDCCYSICCPSNWFVMLQNTSWECSKASHENSNLPSMARQYSNMLCLAAFSSPSSEPTALLGCFLYELDFLCSALLLLGL